MKRGENEILGGISSYLTLEAFAQLRSCLWLVANQELRWQQGNGTL